MDPMLFITLFSSTVVKFFPSLEEYTQYLIPGLMSAAVVVGIFTNLLPKPGQKYLVPDTTALEIELQGSGGFILRIAKFARALMIGTNWFLGTGLYKSFYNATNVVSGVLSKIKLAPKPTTASK